MGKSKKSKPGASGKPAKTPPVAKTPDKPGKVKAKKPAQDGKINYKDDWDGEYPHFRYYLKSKHPALITAEHSDEEYKYRKVMHSEKDGRHTNEIVNPNPDPRENEPMYIQKRVRHDKKKFFSAWVYKWKLHKAKKK